MDQVELILLLGSSVSAILIILIGLWIYFYRSHKPDCGARFSTPVSKKDNFQPNSSRGNPTKTNDGRKSVKAQSEVISQPGSTKQKVKPSNSNNNKRCISKRISEPLSTSQDVQYSPLRQQDSASNKILSKDNKILSEDNQTKCSLSESTWSPPFNSDELLSRSATKKAATLTNVTVDVSSHPKRNVPKQDLPSSSGSTSAPKRKETRKYKEMGKAQLGNSENLEHRKSLEVRHELSTTDSLFGNRISDTFPVQNQLECQEEGVLFIDNSNIFIEGKKFYAKHQKLRVKADPCFRIDIGKLCQALLNGRRMSYGKLYGSEPPDLDTLWAKIREGGLEVDKFERNYKGEEKEVDNALSSDATAYACENKEKNTCETIIFLAGDRDYCPAVENILRRGWKVEVAAFSFSMSSKMKQIARTNKSLKIVELDELLVSYDPCPYYVNRQWRPLRTNHTHRRIPRENTKVFSFKREFDVGNMSDVMNVRKLADTIASLVRIPCNFYCHRTNEKKSRTVFIIFLLSRYVTDDGPDPVGPRKVVGVNLGQAWNDCRGLIDKKCKDIFDEYQLDRYEDAVSFIQSMHMIKNAEQMEMSNAFSQLSFESLPWCTGTDSDVAGNEDDIIDDYDEDFDMFELNGGIDSYDAANEDASTSTDYFKVVKRKPERNHTTSSVQCKYSFSCNHAHRCKKKHSKLENEYFRHCEQHGLVKKPYYKSKPCYRYIKRNCNTGNAEISPCCPFYHSVEESRCYYCIPFSGELGHQATQECADRVDKPYFLSVESR